MGASIFHALHVQGLIIQLYSWQTTGNANGHQPDFSQLVDPTEITFWHASQVNTV